MRIAVEWKIQEVAFKWETGNPIVISLGEGSVLTLTMAACKKYGLSLIDACIGKKLTYVLQSESFPDENETIGSVRVVSHAETDHLAMASLTKEETTCFFWPWQSPPYKNCWTTREMKLDSVRWRIRGRPLPLPRYELTIGLSVRQYSSCKKLPPNTGFKITSISIS